MDTGGLHSTDDLAEAAAIIATGVANYSIRRDGGPWAQVVFSEDVSDIARSYRSGRLEVPALAYTHVLRRLRREIRESEKEHSIWSAATPR